MKLGEFLKARSMKYLGLLDELRFWLPDDEKTSGDVATAIDNLEDVLRSNNYINERYQDGTAHAE